MEDGAVRGPGGGGDNRGVSLEILFLGWRMSSCPLVVLIIVVLILRRLSNVVGFFGIGRGGARSEGAEVLTPSALVMVHVRRRVVLLRLVGGMERDVLDVVFFRCVWCTSDGK